MLDRQFNYGEKKNIHFRKKNKKIRNTSPVAPPKKITKITGSGLPGWKTQKCEDEDQQWQQRRPARAGACWRGHLWQRLVRMAAVETPCRPGGWTLRWGRSAPDLPGWRRAIAGPNTRCGIAPCRCWGRGGVVPDQKDLCVTVKSATVPMGKSNHQQIWSNCNECKDEGDVKVVEGITFRWWKWRLHLHGQKGSG